MSPIGSVAGSSGLPQGRLVEKVRVLDLKFLRENEGRVHGAVLSAFEAIEDDAARDLPRHFYTTMKIVDRDQEERFAPGQPIFLSGLKSLSKAAAIGLARHDGFLMLSGLETLSNGAAEALAKHTGPLHLEGLVSLSQVAADCLARRAGFLGLGSGRQLVDLVKKSEGEHNHATGPLDFTFVPPNVVPPGPGVIPRA